MGIKVIVISNLWVSADYMVDMLNRVGVEAKFLPATKIGMSYKKVKEIEKDIKEFDIVHLISGYQRIKLLTWLRSLGKKVINHWVGSDVLKVLEDRKTRLLAHMTDKLIDAQFAKAKHLIRELKQAGISATYLPSVPPIDKKVSLRYKRGVLVYIPFDRVDFHRGKEILELAKLFPEIDFHVVDNKGKGLPLEPNIHYYGWVDNMEPIWEKVSVLIRYPKHDGLSSLVLEALVRGKWVIWNQRLKHCSYVKNREKVLYELANLLRKEDLNLESRQFVLKEFDPKKIGKQYIEIYENLL